jgi:hypothetical protein
MIGVALNINAYMPMGNGQGDGGPGRHYKIFLE